MGYVWGARSQEVCVEVCGVRRCRGCGSRGERGGWGLGGPHEGSAAGLEGHARCAAWRRPVPHAPCREDFARRVGMDLFRFMESFQTRAMGDQIIVPANVLDRQVLPPSKESIMLLTASCNPIIIIPCTPALRVPDCEACHVIRPHFSQVSSQKVPAQGTQRHHVTYCPALTCFVPAVQMVHAVQ